MLNGVKAVWTVGWAILYNKHLLTTIFSECRHYVGTISNGLCKTFFLLPTFVQHSFNFCGRNVGQILMLFKQNSIGIIIFWNVCHVAFLFSCKRSHNYPSLVNTKTTEQHVFKLYKIYMQILFLKFKEELFFPWQRNQNGPLNLSFSVFRQWIFLTTSKDTSPLIDIFYSTLLFWRSCKSNEILWKVDKFNSFEWNFIGHKNIKRIWV